MKTGSKITGNTATNANGGGIYVSGTFVMEDGIISGNVAAHGGGVYVNNGTFTMKGGTINGNTASTTLSDGTMAYGGGVCLASSSGSGIFTMKGGTINGNTADYGGAIYIVSGIFSMEGGTISGNIATSFGGGVCNGFSMDTFTKTGGVIAGYGNDTVNGNKVMNSSGVIRSNAGHAVYAGSGKHLEKTVTASHNLDSSQDGAAGGWVE
jgi:predicted outer membrane repeat protein